MRRVFFAGFIAALAACHSPEGAVAVTSMEATRLPDGRVSVDVEVYGLEQGGGASGNYCVSIHVLPLGVDPAFTPGYLTYGGELDAVKQCASDLSDGDKRTFRLVFTKTDLVKDYDLRGQVVVAGRFDWKDAPLP